MQTAYDVVIVGAGTAGSYMAWRLSQRGHRVLVVEKQAYGQPGSHIGIFHIDEIRFAQFGIPLPEGQELIGYYPSGLAWSPDGRQIKPVVYGFCVMDMPRFIMRLQGYAQQAGAEILFETALSELILEDGRVAGIRVTNAGGVSEIRGRLVVDASGVDSAVRTRLPQDLGIETEPIAARDFLYVILQYWDDVDSRIPRGLNFYPFQKAFINPSYGTGVIVGIGQPERLENAEKAQQEFLAERFPGVGHRFVKKTWGKTPYRRSPFSLVADGVLIVGDAAFMTKPFSGEGVTSGFTACQIAAEVAHAALTAHRQTRQDLWAYNVRYFRDQGAKFAALFAQLPAASQLSRAEVNYLFEADIIFSSYDFEQMNRIFEVPMGPARLLGMAGKLLKGGLTGRFSWSGLGRLLRAVAIAGQIRQHYEQYPEDPRDFPAWEAKARALWAKV